MINKPTSCILSACIFSACILAAALGSLQPVFAAPAPPPSFVSKVSVSPPAKASKSATVSVSLSDKSKPVAAGNVDLEVYNAQGKKVSQQVWSGQALSRAKSSIYHWSWKPAAPGTYTLKLGVFSSGWKTLNYWADKALVVKVS